MILYSEGATPAQEAEAESIMGILCAAYPNHPWGVRVYDGGFFIQYLDRPFNKPYGMNCHYKDVAHDAAVMKKQIIMMAGEWLERAGLARGKGNGDEIVWVEGVPDRYKPKPIEPNPTDERGVFHGDAKDVYRQMMSLGKNRHGN